MIFEASASCLPQRCIITRPCMMGHHIIKASRPMGLLLIVLFTPLCLMNLFQIHTNWSLNHGLDPSTFSPPISDICGHWGAIFVSFCVHSTKQTFSTKLQIHTKYLLDQDGGGLGIHHWFSCDQTLLVFFKKTQFKISNFCQWKRFTGAVFSIPENLSLKVKFTEPNLSKNAILHPLLHFSVPGSIHI